MNTFFKNSSISRRLALGFAGILLLALIAIGISIDRLNSVAAATQKMLDEPVSTERLIQDWYRQAHTAVPRTVAIAMSSDDTLAAFFAADIAAATKTSSALQKKVEAGMDTEAEKSLFAKVGEMRSAYLRIRDAIFKLRKEGKADEARAVLQRDFIPAGASYLAAANAMLEEQRRQINESTARIASINIASRNLMLGMAVLLVLLGGTLALLLARSITVPLARAVEVAQRVAAGDLTSDVLNDRGDETGKLLDALRQMNGNLSLLVGDVRLSTDTIAVAAHEIAAGNADLSSRTEAQASALEQTTSSMEHLTGTVRRNADNARQANQLVLSASDIAVKGGEEVGQVVSTMGAIKDSSRKIVDIISVIDGIAFQTNILALNAAVEAARAGEQGRGFAVVASEVRNLAQRSASAAKEIKLLIDDSVGKVDEGSRLVDAAGRTMEDVVNSVKQVTDIMSEISLASEEQSSGIGEINAAIAQMDEMTQQNAALVEQASAAAESMREQAQALSGQVSQFTIVGGRAAPSAPVAPKAARPAPRALAVAGAPRKAPATTAASQKDGWEEF
jgi:methyl-accepting chemotaxis protein